MHGLKWTHNILFKGLDDGQLEIIEPHIRPIEFKKGTEIIEDGAESDFMFLIQDGTVNIVKDGIILNESTSGDVVGLMSMIDNSPRTASVVAGEVGATGYIIEKEGWNAFMGNDSDSIVSKVFLNYLKLHRGVLKSSNRLSLQEAEAKLAMEHRRVLSARFFVQMVLGLILFTFMLGYLNEKAAEGESTFISFAVIAIYAMWSYFYVRISGIPIESFGLTMANFKPAMKIVMQSTAVFLGVLFLFKWIMITWFPEVYGTEMIQFYEGGKGMESVWVVLILYSLHAVLQEFIARGCIQGGLLQFIVGKRAGWTAIIVATLMFSSFHLMMDMRFAFLTIIPGLFWGYLFYKEKNILAVSISHILIGWVAIFLLRLVG